MLIIKRASYNSTIIKENIVSNSGSSLHLQIQHPIYFLLLECHRIYPLFGIKILNSNIMFKWFKFLGANWFPLGTEIGSHLRFQSRIRKRRQKGVSLFRGCCCLLFLMMVYEVHNGCCGLRLQNEVSYHPWFVCSEYANVLNTSVE